MITCTEQVSHRGASPIWIAKNSVSNSDPRIVVKMRPADRNMA